MRYGQRRPSTTQYDRPPVEIQEKKPLRTAWLEAKLAERLAEGFEAKIVGTGSYQSVSYKAKKVVKTKLMAMGLCQCCGRLIGATNGVIAHHGYERPEYGYQTPSCSGARYLPLSESSDRAAQVAEGLRRQMKQLDEEMLRVQDATEITVLRRDSRGEVKLVTITPETADKFVSLWDAGRNQRGAWGVVVARKLAELQAEVVRCERTADFLMDVVKRQQAGEYEGTTKEYEVEV